MTIPNCLGGIPGCWQKQQIRIGTSVEIPLLDVYEADVANPRKIRVETYDSLKRKLMGRRSYTFELRDGQHGADLARFLAAHVKRPVVGFRESTARGAVYEIPAYHRHRFGGCHGKLRLDESGIQFVSSQVKDSRTWSYSEIETIGSMNDFHFRVSALAETYNFDLKERLPSAAYELAFKSVARISKTISEDADITLQGLAQSFGPDLLLALCKERVVNDKFAL